ncbi:hypothetical protein [Magnetospirillum sp. 64-120]|uniref:hypothetical protein n=1 Tax=Magnetospirillum sp. 64-120 TaxID=1895778 RepID=UPI00092BC32D|nr:hypothetical protein [Magnetospirillum sp. 64-120]OJX68656.1 MAG: hypothetical protein BGO92_19790 [Magnetospirillum sp. 64-120]
MIRKVLMAAAVLVVGAGSAFAAGKQDFDLVNKTGYPIEEVYVAPSSSDDWQEDVLGQDILENGKKVHIRFNRATKTCKWDLKVVYSDKETAEWEEFDLCETSKIIIKYDRKSGETSAEYE